MSQHPPQPPNQFSNPQSFDQPMPQTYEQAPRQDNTLGLTGFIVSLVGLFLCGIPSLIGLILSALGLKKEPRGLAIAGVIIGLIGLIELAGVAIMTYNGVRMAQQGISQMTELFAEAQLEQAASEIGHKWKELDRVPTQEEGNEIMIGKNDMMNNSLVYETDGASFSIRSAGADGTLETEDDIIVGPFEDAQTAIDLEPDFEDWGEFEAEGDFSLDGKKTPDSPEANSRDLLED